MRDEPTAHPIFLVLLGLAAMGTVPLAFLGQEPTYWLGLPMWLWSSIGFTLLLSSLTAWGVMRYWEDDDLD